MRATAIGIVLALGAAPCALPAQTPQTELERKLGRDPLELLHALGSKKRSEDLRDSIRALRDDLDRLDGQEQLRMLRLGLGSDDERAVFGAVLLMPDQLAVPELRNAVRIVLPRLGDADCPVVFIDAMPLIGSVDMAAIAEPVRKLPPADAVNFLGALHRMVRSENIPSLCQLALATKGAVRGAAFSNAHMAAEYSDEHVPLLVATWLQLHGARPDPDGDGLPGVLAAALRTHLDAPPRRELAKDEPDDREPSLPDIPCMRWLAKSHANVKDLPLLKRLVVEGSGELCSAALHVLGTMTDDESLEFLRTCPPEDHQRTSLLMARAHRGDASALEQLLAGSGDEVAMGLAAASPERRRTFAAQLLTLPLTEAFAMLLRLTESLRGDPMGFAVPPYEDAWLADLEPLVAAKKDLDVRLLLALVGTVPGCATVRLADALLAHPATELFAPGQDGVDELRYNTWRGDLGYSGAWPFLEVTRPELFRQRLREGLRVEDAVCRDRCAEMLVAIGDTEDLDRLVASIERAEDPARLWLRLGRTMTPNVVETLRTRVATNKDGDELLDLLRALAAAEGMPHEFASRWDIGENDFDAVRTALLGRDPAPAFLLSVAATTGVDANWPPLAAWQDARVQDVLRERRRHPDLAPDVVARFDQQWALHANDGAALNDAQLLIRDGRYATHYGIEPDVRCLGCDLATLPFWISELSGNCCRACVAEEVMQLFFSQKAYAFDCARMAEPAFVRLRRRLLPLQNRLRWSRIAEAYVVADS